MAQYRGSNGSTGNNPTSGSWDLTGTNWQPGDVAVFWWYTFTNTKTITEPGTVTQKYDTASAGFGRIFIGYRVLQSGDTTFAWTSSSATNSTTIWGVDVFAGIDANNGDPFEAVSGAPATFSNLQNPDPPSVVTVRDNAMVVTIFGKLNDFTSVAAPSTYSLGDTGSDTAGSDASAGLAYKEIAVGGTTENPGAWTLGGGAATDDGYVWTAALRSAEYSAAQSLATIKSIDRKFAQANAAIKSTAIGSAQVTALINGTETRVADTFTRSVINGWGTADVGGTYNLRTGSGSSFDVDGAQASVISTTSTQWQYLPKTIFYPTKGFAFEVKVAIDKTPTGNNIFFTLGAGFGSSPLNTQSGQSAVKIRLQWTPADALSTVYTQPDNTSFTGATYGTTGKLNTNYIVKGLVYQTNTGTVWLSKIYEEGATEPGYTRSLTTLPAGNKALPGHVIIGTDSVSITNGPVTWSVDDLSFVSDTGIPQWAQANALVKGIVQVSAQTQAFLASPIQSYAQSQALIENPEEAFAQALATIAGITSNFANAIATIATTSQTFAQANAWIKAVGGTYQNLLLYPNSNTAVLNGGWTNPEAIYENNPATVASANQLTTANADRIATNFYFPQYIFSGRVLTTTSVFRSRVLNATTGQNFRHEVYLNGVLSNAVTFTAPLNTFPAGPTTSQWATTANGESFNNTNSYVYLETRATENNVTYELDYFAIRINLSKNQPNAQAQALIYGQYNSVTDTFTRSVTDGFGSSDNAGDYRLYSGSATSFDVNGSSGLIEVLASATAQVQELPEILVNPNRGIYIEFDFTVDQTPTGAAFQFLVSSAVGQTWGNTLNHGYFTTLISWTTANQISTLHYGPNGATAVISGPNIVGATPGTLYRLKTILYKTSTGWTIYRKIYAIGNTEPGFTVSNISNTANLMFPGHIKLGTTGSASITNAPLIVTLDNLNIKDNVGLQWVAQAQAIIKLIDQQVYAQAFAEIILATSAKSQSAQALAITQTTENEFGQANSYIYRTENGSGQAVSTVLATSEGYAQSEAYIILIDQSVFAQAAAIILRTFEQHGQSEAYIKVTDIAGLGQAQGTILQAYVQNANANSYIISLNEGYAQSQANILATSDAYAQAASIILTLNTVNANAQASVLQSYQVYGQAASQILAAYQTYAQAEAVILAQYFGYGQAESAVKAVYAVNGQASAQVLAEYQGYAQANARLIAFDVQGYANAQGTVLFTGTAGSAQALARILAFGYPQYAQAAAIILAAYQQYANAEGSIKNSYTSSASVTTLIRTTNEVLAQTQAQIKAASQVNAQALAYIYVTLNASANAGAIITDRYSSVAQANAWVASINYSAAQVQATIKATSKVSAQAQTYIGIVGASGTGQAQGSILAFNINGLGQVAAIIKITEAQHSQASVWVSARSVAPASAQGHIRITQRGFAQAQSAILQVYIGSAQTAARIRDTYAGQAQANAYIQNVLQGYAQASATVKTTVKVQANALADILQIYSASANAKAQIKAGSAQSAQALGVIKSTGREYAQALSIISTSAIVNGQASAVIRASYLAAAQAQAFVKFVGGFGQAHAYILVTNLIKTLVISDRATITLTLSDRSGTLQLADSAISLILRDYSVDTLVTQDQAGTILLTDESVIRLDLQDSAKLSITMEDKAMRLQMSDKANRADLGDKSGTITLSDTSGRIQTNDRNY